jgi:hypothetical protein
MVDFSAVGDTVTRKAGPLPLWGWAIAVGGAVLAYRLVRGGGSTPMVVTPGPSTGDGSPTAGDTAGDGSSSFAPLSSVDALFQAVANLQAGTGVDTGLELPAGQAPPPTAPAASLPPPTSYTNLLIQLTDAITKRDDVGRALANTQAVLNRTYEDYRAKKISKATYDKRVKSYNASIAQEKAAIAGYTKTIADLRTALGKVGISA